LTAGLLDSLDGTPLFGPRSIRLEPVLAAPPAVPKRPVINLKGAANAGYDRAAVAVAAAAITV
jgi:hypothetical protein